MTINNMKTVVDSTESLEAPITIGIANNLEEKKEIYQFRYKIYIKEMSKQLEETDYENQLLYDEFDKWGFLLYAKIGSEIVGTLRVNVGTAAEFPQIMIDVFSMEVYRTCDSANEVQKFALCTKLMVEPRYRNSTVLYLLMAKSYEIFYSNKVDFVFAYCNLYLLRLYEQMGFYRIGRNFLPTGYGLCAPIVLLINDLAHLRKVRSLFYRMARKKEVLNSGAIEWFYKKFTNHSSTINSQLVSEEELWNILCERLKSQPTEAIPLLRDLSVAEAKKFIHYCGVFVQCEAGDLISGQGDVSYSYDILISGKLKSLTFQRPIKEYKIPGQHFGANGLTEHNRHFEDIAAVDSVEILVLSGLAFQKICRAYPEIAHKIVQSSFEERKLKL